jgi:small GTP-binding protein
MRKTVDYSIKICLVGEGKVGKTSLIQRFVFDNFPDKYITTIGTKISKKDMIIKHPKKYTSVEVRMLVWDIMGQQGFRQMLQDAYFFGCQGVLAVCDSTREDTLHALEDWIRTAYSKAGEVPVVFLANKCDQKQERVVDTRMLVEFSQNYGNSYGFSSSAKTGQNVELAFRTLGEEILSRES